MGNQINLSSSTYRKHNPILETIKLLDIVEWESIEKNIQTEIQESR